MRKSMLKDTLSSSKEINRSPLNRSSSKSLWSFSKDSRFKKSTIYCDKMYEMGSTFRQRGAAMGFGNKSDFTKDLTSSPPVTKYLNESVFDRNKKISKGHKMTLSREKLPQQGYIPLGPLKVPAANKYNNLSSQPGRSFTMRPKTKNLDLSMSITSQNNNPGSGTYENPESLSPKGRYYMSKHKGTGATQFNPKSSVRFFGFSINFDQTLENQNPGPGMYQEINRLSDSGSYVLTKAHGTGKRYFDKEKRTVDFQHKANKNYVPGPGQYQSPSEFGLYDGSGEISSSSFNNQSRRYETIKTRK